MKSTGIRLLAALAICSVAPAPAHAAAPSKFQMFEYQFDNATSSITGAPLGVLARSGMRLVDVQLSQASAGAGGTSWTATPKRNGTALTSTNGGFTLAAGAGKSSNVAGSPMGSLTNPTGGTRPVIQGSVAATQTVTVGADLAADDVLFITSTVSFTAKASGASGWQFNIGTDEIADAAALAALINSHPGSPVAASATNAVITLTAKHTGSQGNAITLAQTGDGFTLGGAALAGGFDWGAAAGDVLTVDVTLSGTYTPTGPSGTVTLYFEAP